MLIGDFNAILEQGDRGYNSKLNTYDNRVKQWVDDNKLTDLTSLFSIGKNYYTFRRGKL